MHRTHCTCSVVKTLLCYHSVDQLWRPSNQFFDKDKIICKITGYPYWLAKVCLIAFYLLDQICLNVSVTKCFYFLTDCCCCKQYQTIGKVLRRSPVDICRPKMELDRDPGGIGIVGRSSARWAPFNGGYDFVFLDKLSPVKFVPPVFLLEECCPDPGSVLFWPLQFCDFRWLFLWLFQVFVDLMFNCHFWNLFLF